MQSWGRRPNAGGAGLEPVARGRAGAGLGLREARISAHAPFPAASSSTTATLGSFLYANRSCQKRSRDPPRGGAAWPAPSREGAWAGGELVPWNPTRTPGGPRAARTSALSCLGLHPFPCVPLRFPCPNSHCDLKRAEVRQETQDALCSPPIAGASFMLGEHSPSLVN